MSIQKELDFEPTGDGASLADVEVDAAEFSSRTDPLEVTFAHGGREPFNRWYPYLEGYSPRFVERILDTFAPGGGGRPRPVWRHRDDGVCRCVQEPQCLFM